MAIQLTRPTRQRVALGPTLVSRQRRPKTGTGLILLAIGSLLVGLLLGLLFSLATGDVAGDRHAARRLDPRLGDAVVRFLTTQVGGQVYPALPLSA